MEEVYGAALADLLSYEAPQGVPVLREAFGSLEKAWKAGIKDLRAAGLLTPALEKVWRDSRKPALPEKIWDWCQVHGVRIISRWSPDYPPLVDQLGAPPPVLYVKGRLPEQPACLAIVGSRKATDYGLAVAARFARAAALKKVPVISGGAYGIDAAAHQAALEAGGLTVAVLGGGLGELYPRRHLWLFDKICEQGALVTEQSPWTPPLPQNFPLRNRIIVGLSRSVLVVEAAIRSGAMSTAHAAADENRDLYAVPGPIDSETSRGTHWLLKQGARLGDDPRELLDSLLGREPGTCTGPAEEEEPDLFGEVSPEEQERAGALYRWIKKHRAQSLEDLAGAFPWPLAVLSTLLLELELGGRIRRNSRNRYSAL